MNFQEPSATKLSCSPLAVEDFDHLEYYVGNAKQAAYYYQHALGFDIVGYQGPETGIADRASYGIKQNDIKIILTTSLQPNNLIAEHVKAHGDGVHAVAFKTSKAEADYNEAISRGAKSVQEPTIIEDNEGYIKQAAIQTYGDTIHRFIERNNYSGEFFPTFKSLDRPSPNSAGLIRIDHIVGNVGWGEMQKWVKFYEQIFGFMQFKHFDEKDINTEYTALRSTVMTSQNLVIKLPINEPAKGLRRSQIEEYVDFYGSPGVQHAAISTTNIIQTVKQLRKNGLEFQSVPETYYEELPHRIGSISEDIQKLKELGILVDRDDDGYLLQIFTKPIEDRPTFFFEIIQRCGSESFGKGNFKALFESIERDQELRKTL